MEQSKHSDGVTSVKVHHRPGGASSIQLGGGYGGEGSVLDAKKATEPATGAAPVTDAAEEEKKEEEQQAAPAAAAGVGAVPEQRTVAPGTASVTDAFGNKVSGTSIKVRAPPGGASSITF